MVKRYSSLPIGKKLQVINLMMTGMITLLTITNLSYYMYDSMIEDSRKNADTLTSVLAENLDSALLFKDVKAAQDVLISLHAIPVVQQAAIFDESGRLFTSYSRTNKGASIPANFDPKLYVGNARLGELTQYYSRPIPSEDHNMKDIGTLTLQLDMTDAYAHLGYQVATLLLIGLIGGTLVSVALSMLQKSITTPLISLTNSMRNYIKESNLTTQNRSLSPDEIKELKNVFDRMVNELSHRENSLQNELKERRLIEAKLSQMAHFDTITNLPNRHSFNSQIERALINYKYDVEKFALMYIDLDNFKYVNDSFGHHIGDLLLARIGERLVNTLRKEDFVARLGGDEFVIIISGFVDTSQISAVARKILEALQHPFTLDDHEAFIGASIGISICPENGNNSETLQRQADSAMYRAKNSGKNNFQFYQDEMSLSQKNRISMEAQLHRALERNEIIVHYQPIIAFESGKIVGFEALVRWIKRDGTIVRPDEFITLAEEIGLIVDIGRYVLNTAAHQTAEWVDRYGLAFTAVNFSSRQFKHNDLASDIFNALKVAQLHAGNFEMEITESVLMDNTIDSKNFMDLMIRQGMGVSIDDFGTGYSSLSYITSFPITKIKIDLSFVAKLPNDKNALAVVTSIIGLAKLLNLKVVAEGIETVEQFECLEKLGCQYGQGYLFSKPVSASEATQLLEKYVNQSMLSNATT